MIWSGCEERYKMLRSSCCCRCCNIRRLLIFTCLHSSHQFPTRWHHRERAYLTSILKDLLHCCRWQQQQQQQHTGVKQQPCIWRSSSAFAMFAQSCNLIEPISSTTSAMHLKCSYALSAASGAAASDSQPRLHFLPPLTCTTSGVVSATNMVSLPAAYDAAAHSCWMISKADTAHSQNLISSSSSSRYKIRGSNRSWQSRLPGYYYDARRTPFLSHGIRRWTKHCEHSLGAPAAERSCHEH